MINRLRSLDQNYRNTKSKIVVERVFKLINQFRNKIHLNLLHNKIDRES